METIIRQCGRFTLVRTEEGFGWRLVSHGGSVWYWDPVAGQWTPHSHFHPTKEAAGAGLDTTLAHELAGDLD